jgi:D-threo-aldose 1-dehydrogenase
MRLGLNSIDLLLIHDLDIAEIGSPDLVEHHFHDLERSGWRALESLRSHGEIAAVGAGVNILGTIPRMLRRFDLDFFLVAMPYTLLDQEPLNEEFPLCRQRSVGVIVGSPFASGILGTGADVTQPWYNYLPAPPGIVEKVREIERVCRAHSVSLKAAAYQFPLRLDLVASVVSGAATPAQAVENARLLEENIPESFWSALHADGLLHPDAP